MLRAFLLLLTFLTDYEAMADFAHGTLTTGLVNLRILSCIGLCLIARRWLSLRG